MHDFLKTGTINEDKLRDLSIVAKTFFLKLESMIQKNMIQKNKKLKEEIKLEIKKSYKKSYKKSRYYNRKKLKGSD